MSFGWGIIGPGRIAHRFADAVHQLPNTHLALVQGRGATRAEAFAKHWTRDGVSAIPSTTSLTALLSDPSVDAVYIATPHPFHADAIAQCLNAGKPVLCEKPLVTDAITAQELSALAHVRKVFLMEAVWTRFLPIYATVREWLASDAIGTLRSMQSSFCFNSRFDPTARHFDPAQAGGALLDIGIYNLTVTRMVMAAAFGECPPADSIVANAVLTPTRVDHRTSAQLTFANGVVSQFVCSFDSDAANAFEIYGERGTIRVAKLFWGATQATLTRIGETPITVDAAHAINGFEGEIEDTIRCVRAGQVESVVVPHLESIAVLQWMDIIRKQIGVRYAFDHPSF
jgi:predicted dehydrogenase